MQTWMLKSASRKKLHFLYDFYFLSYAHSVIDIFTFHVVENQIQIANILERFSESKKKIVTCFTHLSPSRMMLFSSALPLLRSNWFSGYYPEGVQTFNLIGRRWLNFSPFEMHFILCVSFFCFHELISLVCLSQNIMPHELFGCSSFRYDRKLFFVNSEKRRNELFPVLISIDIIQYNYIYVFLVYVTTSFIFNRYRGEKNWTKY